MNKTARLVQSLLGFLILVSTCQLMAQDNLQIPTKVRVKITSVSLPLSISAQGIMVEHLSLEGIKNASLIKDESLQIDKKSDWKIKKDNKVFSTSEKFLKIDSTQGRIKLGIFWYPTPVYLAAENNKRADVILNLKFDDYLRGVLEGEMPAKWPEEVLKAQVIASRSYAYYQLLHKNDEVFHLNGNVLDQVYSLQNSKSKNILKAIKETQNQILMQNNKPLKAYYHSDCGGQTEQPENVWGVGEIKIASVYDKYCKFRTHNHWEFIISKKELAQTLGLSEVTKVPSIEKSESQRVEKITFSDGHSQSTISGQELRQKLGFGKLKSTLFSLTFNQDWVTFRGQGFGHGSGLCQWGARAMALEGKSAQEILAHYYPLAKVSRIEFENQGFKL